MESGRKKMFKKISTIALVSLMVALQVSCGGADSSSTASGVTTQATDGEFILGSPQPLTGVNAQAAQATINGIQLAVDEINEQGGINGQQIRLITYDDQGLPEEAVKIANKMLQVDNVDGVIGPLLSTCQMAQGQLINNAGIPTVAIGLSPTFMDKDWEYVVRSSLNSDYVMKLLAEDMKLMNVSSLAIFSGQDDASKTAAAAMQKEAEAAGITITTVETYVDGDTDFSGQAAKIINSKPDAVFAATYANVQPIIAKQLRQFGFEGYCYNKELFQADSLRLAGENANGWVFAYPYISYSSVEDCDIPIMKEFITSYQEKYGSLPAHEGAMRGYDAVMVFAEGAKLSGSNEPDSIMAGINQIDGYEGLGGTFNYTAGDGEGLHSCNSYIIQDEQYLVLSQWLEENQVA